MKILLAALVLVLACFGATAAKTGDGFDTRSPVVRVNSRTVGYQDVKAAGALAAGGYAVVWDSTTTNPTQDGANFYLQRYDAAGRKAGGETFLYHSPFEHFTQPTVLANGDIVVVHAVARPDGSSSIYLRRFHSSGALLMAETEVVARAATPDGFQLQTPMTTALAGGGFALSYAEGPALSGPAAFYVQRYDGSGAKRYGEIRVDGARPGLQVQADQEGGFFLYRTVANPDGAAGCFGATSEPRTLTVTYHGAGTPVATTVIAAGTHNCADVLRLAGDRFILLGDRTTAPFSQVLDAAGNPIGERKPIAFPVAPFLRASLVGKTVLADGSYILLWRASEGTEIQHYDAVGNLIGTPFVVPDPGPGMKLVALAGGGFSISASRTDSKGDLDAFTQLFEQDGNKIKK